MIEPTTNTGSCQVFEDIINKAETTSIYLKFTLWSTGGIDNGLLLNVKTIKNGANGNNILMYSNSTSLKFTNANGTFTQTIDVPSTSTYYNNFTYHVRELMLHIDTVQNFIKVYCKGLLCDTITIDNDGENIDDIIIGNLNANGYNMYKFKLKDIIISTNEILPTEAITEVTPTITSTAWTVSSGTATTDTVGASMTLTAPSGSIDETRRSVTGYGVAFLDASSASTINALNITQDSTTKQVLLPSSGAVETSDTFAVAQLSSISATVTSAYVSS